jgi:hypothetical protein
VVTDRQVAPDLVFAPAEDMLDLLVALLDPHPQPVQPLSEAAQLLKLSDTGGVAAALCGPAGVGAGLRKELEPATALS